MIKELLIGALIGEAVTSTARYLYATFTDDETKVCNTLIIPGVILKGLIIVGRLPAWLKFNHKYLRIDEQYMDALYKWFNTDYRCFIDKKLYKQIKDKLVPIDYKYRYKPSKIFALKITEDWNTFHLLTTDRRHTINSIKDINSRKLWEEI